MRNSAQAWTRFFLGSARASRAVFGALAENLWTAKVRDGEAAIASTRGACAPRKIS